MAGRRLAATVLAAALLGGCGTQAETKQAQETEEIVADGASQSADEVEERPYEFRDIFPDGTKPLHKKPSGDLGTVYAGSVPITVPDPRDQTGDGAQTEMWLHVMIEDFGHDYASRGWQEDDLLNFRVTYGSKEIRISDAGVNLRCGRETEFGTDFVKDEIYGGTFTPANRKSRKNCNRYMEAYAEKMLEALNAGEEWRH